MKARLRVLAILLFTFFTGGAGFWMAVQLNAGPAPLPEPASETVVHQVLKLEEIYVNLKTDPAHDSPADKLMRIKLAVLYDPADMPGVKNGGIDSRRAIAAEEPQIRDLFVNFLRQLNEKDLEGSIGMETLKSELLKRARLATGHDAPKDILIGELIIQ